MLYTSLLADTKNHEKINKLKNILPYRAPTLRYSIPPKFRPKFHSKFNVQIIVATVGPYPKK